MLIDDTVSLSSNVQAQPAVAGGTITMDISIFGNVEAQPATGTGSVGVIVSISGNVQAQPATGTVTTSRLLVQAQSLSTAVGIML